MWSSFFTITACLVSRVHTVTGHLVDKQLPHTLCFVDFTKSDLKLREVKSPNIRSHCIDLPSPVYVIFNRKLIPGDKSGIL